MEYEVCDFRFDEGIRTRIEKDIMPTIPARDPKSVSGVPYTIERERESRAIALRGREDGQKLEFSNRNISNAITTVEKDSMVEEITKVRIRKLTPKECWRLMGFTDEDFEKAKKVNSDTRLYQQAGNSIVVQVLEDIFQNLIRGEE